MSTNANQTTIATSMAEAINLTGPQAHVAVPLIWEEELLGQGAGLQKIDLRFWDKDKREDFIRFFVGYGLRAATKSATAGRQDKRKARQDRLDAIQRGEWRTRQPGEKAESLAKSVIAGLKAWLMAEFSRRTGADLRLSATVDPEKMLDGFATQLLDAMVGAGKWGMDHKIKTIDKFRPAFEAESAALQAQAAQGAEQIASPTSADDFLSSL